jgi:hypothetical protein
MSDRHLAQQLQRHVVEDLAVLHDATMTVIHVLAETDIGDDDEIGKLVLDRPHGHLDDALGIVGAGGGGVFVRGDAEKQNRADPQAHDLADLVEQVADGELEAAGHRGDGVLHVLPRDDEERVDEIVHLEGRLAQHVADSRSAAQPPHPVAGVVHELASFRTGAARSPLAPAIFPREPDADKRPGPLRRGAGRPARLSARPDRAPL